MGYGGYYYYTDIKLPGSLGCHLTHDSMMRQVMAS